DKPGVLRIFNLQGQEVSVVTLPRPDFDIQTVYNLRWSSKNPTISFLQDRNLYLANLDGSNMRFVNLAEFLTNIPGDNRNKEYSGSYLRRRINPQPF
ncbi:hypothetical protein M1437_01810, partial [Patescibacteria group bacterium]|nr:hypothetical protein [Patescibacteria group bacterium]